MTLDDQYRTFAEGCLADFCLTSHQSAEPCISINRLRCRLRNHTPTTQATTITPSPAPTMTPVETQALVAPDVHSFAAPSAAANTIIAVATLIPERAFYISLMNTIIAGVTLTHSCFSVRLLAKGVNALARKCLKRQRLGGTHGCVSEAKDQIVGVAGRPGRTDAKENHEVFCFDQVTLSARVHERAWPGSLPAPRSFAEPCLGAT